MEHSYESAAALVCTSGGAIAEHLVAFVNSLILQQYSVSYACQLAQHALAFGHWCEDSRISFHALKDDDIVRYQRLRSRRRSRCLETRRRELHALELLMGFLRDRGVCHAAQTNAVAADEVVEEFAQSLKRDQGLAVVTVESYARLTRKFLVWRFGQGEVCLCDIRVTDASAFVKSEAKRVAPAALKNVVKALRSFLRYAHVRGEVTAGLAASVPAVASWASTPLSPERLRPSTRSAQLTVATAEARWVDAIAPCCCFWRDWDSEPARSSG